ncbi:MAG: TetR family transcriptional regulator [Negativicutes bacterium]|nr:TetR family transcriptional regulator [Negativicutes bacterium]
MEKDAQAKLIAAATPLFAQKGFTAVTIRELAEAAEVNVAAISYYFGGKEALYQAVLEGQIIPLSQVLRLTEGSLPLPPEERLAVYAKNIASIHRQRPYFVRIMLSELTNPTNCLEIVVRYIEPVYQFLYAALQDGVRDGHFKPDLDIGHAVLSLVGILNFYFIGQPVARKFLPMSEHSDIAYTEQAFAIFLNGVRRKGHE